VKKVSIAEAVQWAEEHLFERNSVVLECQVWQEALGRARGESVSVSELKAFTWQRGYIRDNERPGEMTLRDVLLREWEIVQTVKEGVAACHPLVANPRPPASPSCGLSLPTPPLCSGSLPFFSSAIGSILSSYEFCHASRITRCGVVAKGNTGDFSLLASHLKKLRWNLPSLPIHRSSAS